uniref:hypothetical protein n=1 Tax=Flavobacterium sp. TaxID=239 RepID=UPI00404B8E7E
MTNRLIDIKLSYSRLIIGFIIVLIFSSNDIKAQDRDDIYIYSTVIDSFMNQWNNEKSDRNEIVLIEKFKPVKNYANEVLYVFDSDTTPKRKKNEADEQFANQHFVIQETLGNEKIYRECDFDCYGNLINDNVEIRKTIESLKEIFYNTPNFKNTKLNINRKYYVISNFRRNLFFKHVFGYKITKGWKRFYKKFPNSVGYFQFSPIAYNKNYACFYMERRTNGLSASGDIIIMKFENMIWKQIAKINLWVS